MKTKLFFTILTILLVSFGCKKMDYDNPEVENYISLLKNGKYNSYELPEFNRSDISALLIYRNDTTIIYKFPVNPISSYAMMKCKLGIVVLWTVESIRAVEIDSENLIGRFPSQDPLLALRDNPSVWVFDEESHLSAAKAYYNWWKSNPIFTNKMKIDPLNDTKYIWH
ncbi:MAG: DUF4943 domain-containing protein [Bacteroidales bacterium]|nr:DUF4943 domain-containing protein [Bacteroidales bacterium]